MRSRWPFGLVGVGTALALLWAGASGGVGADAAPKAGRDDRQSQLTRTQAGGDEPGALELETRSPVGEVENSSAPEQIPLGETQSGSLELPIAPTPLEINGLTPPSDPASPGVNQTRISNRGGELPGPGQPQSPGTGTPLRMIEVKPGNFVMGTSSSDGLRKADEWFNLGVYLTQGFKIGEFEVTQAEFVEVMGFNPSFAVDERRPVEGVTYLEAQEFCRRLTDRERRAGRILAGEEFRLPTEAEWEFAARAGARTRYYFGDDPAGLASHAWYSGNTQGAPDPTRPSTQRVGQLGANAWGLRDVLGNVAEWCSDWYSDPTVSPPGGVQVDPSGPATGLERVVRGGAWNSTAAQCRVSARARYAETTRYYGIGFRVALGRPLAGYQSGFDVGPAGGSSPAGPEWSVTKTSVTPNGRRGYLGPFGAEGVRLNLGQNLPAHTAVSIELDLFVMGSWDGNHPKDGPDVWAVRVAGGETIWRGTFLNETPGSLAFGQSYPSRDGKGVYPALTGAAEVGTLGVANLEAVARGRGLDSVYHLEFTFEHRGPSLSLEFLGEGLSGGGDEQWGLDQVRVRYHNEPQGVFVFADPAVAVTEGDAGTAQPTAVVRRVGGSTGTVRFLGATASYPGNLDTSATAREDFNAAAPQFQFLEGETEKPFRVTVLGDSNAEKDERLRLTIFPSGSSLAILGAHRLSDLILLDDDTVLEMEPTEIVTTELAGFVPVRVVRRGDLSKVASVRVVSESGTALEGVDYGRVDTRLVFGPGEDRKVAVLPILDNAEETGERVMSLALSEAAVGLRVVNGRTIVRIRDDDRPRDPARGANWIVRSVLTQPDGKVLLGGAFQSVSGVPRKHLARLTPLGDLDGTFDLGAGLDGDVRVLALQDLGGEGGLRILVGGDFTHFGETPVGGLCRLFLDGRLDTEFGGGGGGNGSVLALAVQADGKVVVGGTFTEWAGRRAGRLVRLLADGRVDTGFDVGQGANQAVHALLLHGRGRVLVGGDFTTLGGVARGRIGSVTTNGSPDRAFSGALGANGRVSAFLQASDGGILVGGQFTQVSAQDRRGLVKVRPTGELDLTFVSPDWIETGGVASLAEQADRRIVIGGDFVSWTAPYEARVCGEELDSLIFEERRYLARVCPDGALDADFGGGGGPDGAIWSVGVAGDGAIWLAGEFQRLGDSKTGRFARLEGGLGLPDLGGNAPSWVLQPRGGIVVAGDDFRLVSVASGAAPLRYEWRRNGEVLTGPGTDGPILQLPKVQEAQEGSYRVRVWNDAGEVWSRLARVEVVAGPRESKGVQEPIEWDGWNADAVEENDGTGSVTGAFGSCCVLFEAGLGGREDGLPSSGRFRSSADFGVTFQIEPYGKTNALILKNGSPPAFLTLREPARYESLALLMAASGGSGPVLLTLEFRDGHKQGPIVVGDIPDWYDGVLGTGRNPAISGLGVRRVGSVANEFETGLPLEVGYSLHQVDLDLKALRVDLRELTRITFQELNNADATGVFAISGRQSPSLPITQATIVPAQRDVAIGDSVTLEVGTDGTGPFRYQWKLNGEILPGATGRSLTVAPFRPENGGRYTVIVSNGSGNLESGPALIRPQLDELVLSDSFAGRLPSVLNAPSGVGRGLVANATLEAGEPLHDGKPSGGSVWLSYLAPADGVLRLSTAGSDFDTILAVYSGSALAGLTVEGSDDDGGAFYTSQLGVPVVAGRSYSIAIASRYRESGQVVFRWSFSAFERSLPVIRTQPESRTVDLGTVATFSVVATGADTYQWMRNGVDLVDDGRVINTRSATLIVNDVSLDDPGNYAVRLGLNGSDQIVMSATAALQLRGGGGGEPSPGLETVELLYDKFSDAFEAGKSLQGGAGPNRARGGVSLSGTSLGRSVTTIFYAQGDIGTESKEPLHCKETVSNTKWGSLSVRASETVILDTAGSEVGALVSVYRHLGDPTLPFFTQLQEVACNKEGLAAGRASRLSFSASPGEVYYFAYGIAAGKRGNAVLTVRTPGPLAVKPLGVDGQRRFAAEVSGTPGHLVTVQSCLNLGDVWTDIGTAVISGNGRVEVLVPMGDIPVRFFRVTGR